MLFLVLVFWLMTEARTRMNYIQAPASGATTLFRLVFAKIPAMGNKKPASIPRDFVKPHLIEVEPPGIYVVSAVIILSQAKE